MIYQTIRHIVKFKPVVIAACCMFLQQQVFTQVLKREQILSAYIFNFAKNIIWQDEDQISEFHFLIISDDNDINLEMKNMSKSQTINGKAIRITVSGSVIIPEDAHLIFIPRGLNDLTEPVFRRIEGRNMLLVSEGVDDKRFIMINFFETTDKKIKFEINKSNIINQGLKVLPEMVLLGGTEIDVAKLYKESQDTLRIKNEQMEALQQNLDSLNMQIDSSHKRLAEQYLTIRQQNQEIRQQQDKIKNQQDELKRLSANEKSQQDKLSMQAGMLNKSGLLLKQQQSDIDHGKTILAEQQSKIDSQNTAILSQKKILEKQGTVIKAQKKILQLLVVTIVLTIGLTYTIFMAYKNKKRSNQQLQEQKDKLQEALEELKIAKNKAQQYLDIAGVILIVVDADCRVVLINQKGCEILGTIHEEIIGKDLFRTFVPKNFRQNAIRNFRLFMAGETEPVKYFEYPVLTRNGEQRLIAWHNTLLRDESDNIIGTLSSGEDITERKHAEKQIERLNHELQNRAIALEAANKELEAFAYSVSHDLRAPLRSIDGFSHILSEGYIEKLDPRGQDSLNRIRNAAQRMSQLIDDMLKLSRVTRSEMNIQEVNLSELVKEIAGYYQNPEAGRKVEFNIQDKIVVKADKHLMQIVMDNLIGNAWKYTSKRPAALIEFGMKKRNENMVYFVRDNGAGFDMNYANKLFGAFQRLHDSTEFTGTGIGLATVQRIIHRHGGKVWAEGIVEKGATFYFTLP